MWMPADNCARCRVVAWELAAADTINDQPAVKAQRCKMEKNDTDTAMASDKTGASLEYTSVPAAAEHQPAGLAAVAVAVINAVAIFNIDFLEPRRISHYEHPYCQYPRSGR